MDLERKIFDGVKARTRYEKGEDGALLSIEKWDAIIDHLEALEDVITRSCGLCFHTKGDYGFGCYGCPLMGRISNCGVFSHYALLKKDIRNAIRHARKFKRDIIIKTGVCDGKTKRYTKRERHVK